MKNVACICSTSENYNTWIDEWVQTPTLNYDKFSIVDVSKNNNFNKGFIFTECELRTNLNFNQEVSKLHYWNSFGNRNIVWFYAHLRMINFYIQYPDYEYYWFFDDDVRIDDWNKFLLDTNQDLSDFISYFVFKRSDVISQPNIPIIDDRTFSKHVWFERFPGPGDELPLEITEYFGSFFPTTRFSNRAMQLLTKINHAGYFGYGEGFVPTVLNHHGLSLNTLIKPNNKSDLFNNKQNKVYHKNEEITWEWI
jgi:hypothetical protein